MKQTIRPFPIIILGALIFVAGFFYDIVMAGTPFPDPTPEIYAHWQYHKRVSSVIYRAGLLAFAIGAIWGLYLWLKKIVFSR